MLTRSTRAANPLTLRLGRWRPAASRTRAVNPHPFRSRHGYVIGLPVYLASARALGPAPWQCAAVVDERGHLMLTPAWASACFVPAYHRARISWGPNKTAIATEVTHALWPWASVGRRRPAAEVELHRRIELAVAVLLNAVRYPPPPAWPLAPQPHAPAWMSALVTGSVRA